MLENKPFPKEKATYAGRSITRMIGQTGTDRTLDEDLQRL